MRAADEAGAVQREREGRAARGAWVGEIDVNIGKAGFTPKELVQSTPRLQYFHSMSHAVHPVHFSFREYVRLEESMMKRALKDAVAELKRDPSHPVEAEIDGLRVEIRVMPRRSAADVFREIGPWEGESTEEVLRRLEDARRTGGFSERPEL